MRTLEELTQTDDPAWPLVQEWIAAASSPVEVLPRDEGRASATLLALQVTTRSPLGAVAYESGGILVDHGWVRILGSGHPRLDVDLRAWNGLGGLPRVADTEGLLIVAHDALGGFFALDGGALGPGKGGAYYFTPDTLKWQDMERGYTDLLGFLLGGNLDRFYGAERWPGWKQDVAGLSADRGFSQYPPAWAAESRDASGKPLPTVSRRAVPMQEMLLVNLDTAAQLARSAR